MGIQEKELQGHPDETKPQWIGTDLGKFAIHTTRKRMIGVQRQLKMDIFGNDTMKIIEVGV